MFKNTRKHQILSISLITLIFDLLFYPVFARPVFASSGHYGLQITDQTKYVDKYFEVDQNGNFKVNIYLGDQKLGTADNTGINYYLTDHLGSPTIITNQSGEIVETNDYESYGKVKDTNSQINNPYKFTGREYDEESALQYFINRYYDDVLGRFISIDPMSINNVEKYLSTPQELNGYAYAINNPLKFIDPLGLYNIKTGEIEKGDTQDSITQLINKTFNINTNWNTIADVSFYKDNFRDKTLDQIVGQKLNVGTNITADITDQLNTLNTDRARIASKFGPMSLLNFRTNGPWDIKSSSDNVLGKGDDGKRDYWSYIYNGELIRYDAPGNINYGYVARASGLKAFEVQSVAKLQQIGDNLLSKKGLTSYDNPGDYQYVQKGINSYNASRSWWQKILNW